MRKMFLIFSYFILSQSIFCQKIDIGTRQVHLDFHTSPHINDIGKGFSKIQFQNSLKTGNVNHINIFAKCHHGLAYYPTKYGKQHPNLSFDLLGEQIDACHEMDIKCPIYFTVGLSEQDAIDHPEWTARTKNGDINIRHDKEGNFFEAEPDFPKPESQWYTLCLNTDYHELIKKQVTEICENYEVDGFWFDIYNARTPCYCKNCVEDMQSLGIDTSSLEQVVKFKVNVYKKHFEEINSIISKYHPNATVFYNGTTAIFTRENFIYELYQYNSYQDLEDLPTTDWCDYDRLPILSKFYLNEGYKVTGMSGKFHTGWGEFGGFKHPNAIKYEGSSMISFGANCNFGDQLHPYGLMDESTYNNIGFAYKYIETIEEFGIGGKPESRLGLWLTFYNHTDESVAKMLLQEQMDFNIANINNTNQFDVIIIPDRKCLNEKEAKIINSYVKNGGKLIVMGDGALNPEGDEFIIDVGAKYLGEAEFKIDYLVLGESLNENLVSTPFLNYYPALRIAPEVDTEVLATIREPYFNRTMEKFSGHQNTPYRMIDANHPGIIKNGNVIYFAHNLASIYAEYGAVLHREIFAKALRMLHTKPMVETELPSTARINLLHQADKNRYVLHLLYGPTILRGNYEIIEDLPPLYNVKVSVDLPKNINSVYQIPSMQKLEIEIINGKQSFIIPEFSCHTGIVFEY